MTTYKRNGQPISHNQMVNACALAGITSRSDESYYQAIQRLAKAIFPSTPLIHVRLQEVIPVEL